MAPPRSLGLDLCAWLGIDPSDVVGITLHAEVDGVSRVTVERLVLSELGPPPTTTYDLVPVEPA
jgi:hypothetical protein